MNRNLRSLRVVLVVAIAALAVAAFGGAPAVSAPGARASNAIACTLLSPQQLKSTLKLGQSIVLRNYDPTVAISEAIDTECGWGVWSGAAPTTPAAMFAFARSGHAAQIAIQTWAPHQGHEQDWIDTDYDKLTGRFEMEGVTFPGLFSSRGLPAHALHPPRLGHGGTGFVTAAPGLARGLKVAIGCWWEDQTYKAICVFDEEAAYRPVAAHMLAFAKIAVAKFLG